MTSKDGEYWKCWSCDQSYSKVELFRIQNSLSYEEACVGLLRHYGIVPVPIGSASVQPLVWLNREEMEALGFFNGGMQIQDRNGGQVLHTLIDLFNEDPDTYYSMVIARTDEMIQKYKAIFEACGNRNSPKASLVYDYMGEKACRPYQSLSFPVSYHCCLSVSTSYWMLRKIPAYTVS